MQIVIKREVSCELDPAEGLYEHALYVTERYRNSGIDTQVFVDAERTGAVVFRSISDVASGPVWLDFVSDYEPPLSRMMPKLEVPAGTDVNREAVVILTVRKAAASRISWPLLPGNRIVQVRALRLRKATAAEEKQHETPFVWMDLRSQPLAITLPDGVDLKPCPASF